jgi:hypothetical protein
VQSSSKVNELINPTTGNWDEELIRSIFNPLDAKRILQIPLNLGAFDDFFLSCHGTKTGISL